MVLSFSWELQVQCKGHPTKYGHLTSAEVSASWSPKQPWWFWILRNTSIFYQQVKTHLCRAFWRSLADYNKLPQKLIITDSIISCSKARAYFNLSSLIPTGFVLLSLPNQNTWMHNQLPRRRERTNYTQQTDVKSLNPVQGRVQTLLRAWKFQNLYSTVPKRFPTQQNSGLLELSSIPFSVAYFSC